VLVTNELPESQRALKCIVTLLNGRQLKEIRDKPESRQLTRILYVIVKC